jgi:hypothetical protein
MKKPNPVPQASRPRFFAEAATVPEVLRIAVCELFRSRLGMEAERLTLTASNGRDLGAWAREAVADLLGAAIFAALEIDRRNRPKGRGRRGLKAES